jgi:hypothetical protein
MSQQATKPAMKIPTDSGETRPMHEEIAALAYSFWLERGCPEGTPEQDWFRAEQELKAE